MTLLTAALFAGAMFALALTPGPGVFATVATALASGFSRAAMVALGIVAGDLLFLMAAVFGLGALAEWMGGLFTIVKWLGAAYLIWLGIKLWRSEPSGPEASNQATASAKASFTNGLFITLGNPKVILFYLGFLPAFVDLSSLTATDVTVIAVVVSLVLGATMLGYAYAASSARRLFQTPRAKTVLNRASGGVMIATGTVLAAKA